MSRKEYSPSKDKDRIIVLRLPSAQNYPKANTSVSYPGKRGKNGQPTEIIDEKIELKRGQFQVDLSKYQTESELQDFLKACIRAGFVGDRMDGQAKKDVAPAKYIYYLLDPDFKVDGGDKNRSYEVELEKEIDGYNQIRVDNGVVRVDSETVAAALKSKGFFIVNP